MQKIQYMYNTEFLCTYKLHENEISDYYYKIQLMATFNMSSYDETMISESVGKIYKRIEEDEDLDKDQFNSILLLSASRFFSADKEIGFTLLFSYDTFDLLHRCLIDYFDCGIFKKEHIDKLHDFFAQKGDREGNGKRSGEEEEK